MDYSYLKASDGNGDAALMIIQADRSIGATTISVNTVSNVPQKFIGTSGDLLPSGFLDPSTITNFYGHLDGSNIEIDGFAPGSIDKGNIEDQVVIIKPNTFSADMIADAVVDAQDSLGGPNPVKLVVSPSQPPPDPNKQIIWFEPL